MPDTDLTGQVALLTGASGGIGGALGRRLIEARANVAFTYSTHAEEAEQLAAAAKDAGLDAVALPGDMADPHTPAQVVEQAVAALGPIDILVANHGTSPKLPYTDIDLAAWDRTVNTNLRAPFLLAQAVLPGMTERGYGRILFTSSVAAFVGGVIGPHYAASKAGLHGLVHGLSKAVAGRGVTVNALAPALILETRMFPTMPPDALPVPVGRYGQPDEVADLAMAMLRNGYLTNQIVSLNGGMHPR